jgi:hypothetical protein
MSVKLDWEIEAERAVVTGIGESPQEVRRRRVASRQAILAVALIVLTILGVIGVIFWRLWTVDRAIEQQLRDVVAAETTALRIGDIAGYLAIQRSDSDAWLLGQTDLFWNYQQLKLEHTVDLSGRILDLAIDESRARVMVEEIIDGRPHRVLWFYWRYTDGWRHVPMDVEFWGGDALSEGENFSIAYGGLDEPLAMVLRPSLETLWGQGCAWLGCAAPLPSLTVRVLPDPTVGVSWSSDEANTLMIASPLTGRARADVPIEPDLQRRIGDLLAQRVLAHATAGLTPLPEADAAFLYNALEEWLVGRFLGGAPGSTFIESLAQSYGERAVGILARALRPDSSIALFSTVFPLALDELVIDWREFFQWRLALELFLLSQGNSAALLGLYDASALEQAFTLIDDPDAVARPIPTVLSVSIGPGSDGVSRAWVTVQTADGGEAVITFRLADGVWKRSLSDPAYPATSSAMPHVGALTARRKLCMLAPNGVI